MTKTPSPLHEKSKEFFKKNLATIIKGKNSYWENSDLQFITTFDLDKPSHIKNNSPELDIDAIKKIINVEDFHPLVFLNGYWVRDFIPLAKEIKVESFEKIDEENSPYFTKILQENKINNFFLYQSLAYFKEGLIFKLKENQKLSKPILLLFLHHQENTASFENLATNNLLVFDLAKSSKLSLVEMHTSLSHNLKNISFNNRSIFFHIAPQAEAKHFVWQNQDDSNFHVHTNEVELLAQANYKSYVLQQGSKISISQKKIDVLAKKAKAILNGLYLANKTKNFDHLIDIEHKIGESTSEQNYLGFLKDESKVGFTGKVNVYPDAQKTESNQLNKTIILDKRATMKSRPQLEIYADDVKCGHGATVGKLEEESIFYLMSRGITGKEAQRILAYAFAKDFFAALEEDFPRLKNWLSGKLLTTSFWDEL